MAQRKGRESAKPRAEVAPIRPAQRPARRGPWPDRRRWVEMPDGTIAYEFPTFAKKDARGEAIIKRGGKDGKYDRPPEA